MELPRELKRLVEKYKAKYNLNEEDDEILKKVIPQLEDEDIIKIYDELCEEENYLIFTKKGYRPNFEKYREEMLNYLDDSVVKAEIVKREQRQSSKALLEQRNYTYISEFTLALDNKEDRRKIINSFHKKVKQLEEDRRNTSNMSEDQKEDNIELSIHILKCIKHIIEKMDIDLILYRGPNFKNIKLKVLEEFEDKLKKLKKEKYSKEFIEMCIKERILNQVVKQIQQLELEEKQLKEEIER